MVRRVLSFFSRETSGLHSAALLLAASALASQALGLLRDRLLTHSFGAGTELDLYFAAFKIPDLIFVGLVPFVSLSVVIPLLAESLERGHEEARRFLDSTFTVFMAAMLLSCVAAYFAMPTLALSLFSGFPRELVLEELVPLSRLLLLSPILLGISSLYAGITQTARAFTLYALSPILYNMGIIGGVLFLYPAWGLQGIGLGVVLGALLHAAVQIPLLLRQRLMPRVRLPRAQNLWHYMREAVQRIITLSLPRSIALSAQQLVMIVLVSLATRFREGSVAVFSLGFNLQSMPLAIIGVAYSTAAFPALARLAARGKQEVFRERLAAALRHVIFWSLPTLVLFIVLRAHIVRLILGSGGLDLDSTRLVAAVLAAFSLSIVAQSVGILLVRGFYAAGETKRPLMGQLFGALVTVLLAFVFMRAFARHPSFSRFVEMIFGIESNAGSGVLALALAASIGSLAGASTLWVLFERSVGGMTRAVRGSALESAIASTFLGGTALVILRLLSDAPSDSSFWVVFFNATLAGLGGSGIALLALMALGNRELKELGQALRSRIRPITPIAAEELRM